MEQCGEKSHVTRLCEYPCCFASLACFDIKCESIPAEGRTSRAEKQGHVGLAGLSARNPRVSFRHDVLLLEFYKNLALLT